MSDTRAIKPEDNKGGTFTQQLDVAEVTTAYVSPVPAEAPGVITAEPGTVKEEAIYFKTRDAGAGTISGLTRDYTNLNGGVGQEHANSIDWEVFQSAFYVKNLVDILLEGFFREQNTVARVDDDNFTVLGNVAIFYTTGRLIRFNGDNEEISSVVSSSYSAGTGLTTVVTAAAVPATLTYVELGLQPKTAAYLSNQDILDEDDMASNSATKAPSQQSIKAYADAIKALVNKNSGGTVVALEDVAAPALDASLGSIFTLSATGNRTIAVPSNPTDGQKIIIIHHASGGARTLALNTGAGGFIFGEDVDALTATTSGKRDVIGCIYNAALGKWMVVAVSKGY